MSETYETDRSLLGAQLAASWTQTPIHVQNQHFTPPTPTGKQSAPVCWVGFAVEYDRPQTQLTFSGTEQKFGVIKHGIFQEQDTGDAKARQIVDDLLDLWAAVNITTFQIFPKECWLEPPLSDDTWDAYVLNIPFWRIVDGSVPTVVLTYGIALGNGWARSRLYNTTTDSTPTALFLNGVNQRLTIEAGVTAGFEIRVIARASAGSIVAHYVFQGTISNNAGTTALQGDIDQKIIFESSPAAYSVAITADDTNDALIVTVTGAAHWEATVDVHRSSV